MRLIPLLLKETTFEPFYTRALKPILESIFKEKYIGGYFEIQDDAQFGDTVRAHTGIEITTTQAYLNNNFPQFPFMTLRGKKLELDIRGGASGIHRHDSEAIRLRAQGEFLERLSVAVPIEHIKGATFDMKRMKDLLPTRAQTKKLWGIGSMQVPIEHVYYGLPRSDDFDYMQYGQPTSNGAAGHFDTRRALTSGILELIERDAFFMYWLNTLSPKKITLREETSPDALSHVLEKLKQYQVETHILDMTTDIAVPVVCVLLRAHTPDGFRIGLGTKAGFGGRDMIASALGEALGILNSAYHRKPFDVSTNQESPTPIVTQEDRYTLYTNKASGMALHFLLEHTEAIDYDAWCSVSGKVREHEALHRDTSHTLNYLIQIFKRRAQHDSRYTLHFHEYKNKLLSHFGYHVVKVFCEALYPLYLTEQYRNYAHPRIKEFLTRTHQEVFTENTSPHPFT